MVDDGASAEGWVVARELMVGELMVDDGRLLVVFIVSAGAVFIAVFIGVDGFGFIIQDGDSVR